MEKIIMSFVGSCHAGALKMIDFSNCTKIAESVVRIYAIYFIASMELELIRTGQDGTLLLPVAFIVGLVAGVKITDLKECFTRK